MQTVQVRVAGQVPGANDALNDLPGLLRVIGSSWQCPGVKGFDKGSPIDEGILIPGPGQ